MHNLQYSLNVLDTEKTNRGILLFIAHTIYYLQIRKITRIKTEAFQQDCLTCILGLTQKPLKTSKLFSEALHTMHTHIWTNADVQMSSLLCAYC